MGNIRDKQVNFRVSEEKYSALKERAENQGKTISLYLNDLVSADLALHKDSFNSDFQVEVLKRLAEIENRIVWPKS